jgi:hypothetical protein
MPMTAERTPEPGELAPLSIASTAWLPVGPRSERNCPVRASRTASPPKKIPAMLTTMSNSGPIEKTE